MMRRSATDLIVAATLIANTDARFETPLKKKGAGGVEVAKNIRDLPFFYKKVVNLNDEPVSLDTFQNFDPNVRSTGGFYSITYIPSMDKRRRKGKPYLIWQDLIGMQIAVSGPKHLSAMGHRIPEIGWLNRWSTLTGEMFAIAKKHPSIPFYFTVKWEKYCKMIEEKAAEQGVDIDHRAFVVYGTSNEKRDEINRTHKLASRRIRADVHDILKELDEEYSGKEEGSNENSNNNN